MPNDGYTFLQNKNKFLLYIIDCCNGQLFCFKVQEALACFANKGEILKRSL